MDQSLIVFIAVVEHESFTRAAEELHMTQPAISQYIQTLERTMGAKLLDRTNKYVRVTKAGEIVYHHAKEIMGGYFRMQSLVDELSHKAVGKISIGASYTFGEYILPHILSDLAERFPLIRPAIAIGNTKEIAELVLEHQVDIGIVEGDFQHRQLTIEAFEEDQMWIVVPAHHRYANNQAVEISALETENWIIRESGSGTRAATDNMFARFNLKPDNMMELGSTQIIKESVEAGLGITLLSHSVVRKELILGTVKLLQVEGFPIKRHFSVVTRHSQFYTKATEIFRDLLRRRGDALKQ